MKFENIVSYMIILIFGMTIGAITTTNITDSNKIEIQKLQTKLYQLQEKNLDLIQENLTLK